MRVLVTGGTGFVGAALAARARADGHDAVTLDAEANADIGCDVGDPDAVRRAVRETQPDAIVHLAALLTDAADRDPVGATRVNALGTSALFAAAHDAGVQRVIYASSISAVGRSVPGAGDAVALDPGSVYGVTKAFGELLARAMSARDGAPSHLSLRLGYVYGPRRERGWREPQQLIERVVAGERRIRYPDFPDPLDWTWIDDAVERLARALVRPLPRFAAVNALGDSRSIRDVIALLHKRFPDLVAEPYEAATPPSAWGLANDAVDRLLGSVRTTRVDEGIDRIIALARAGAMHG